MRDIIMAIALRQLLVGCQVNLSDAAADLFDREGAALWSTTGTATQADGGTLGPDATGTTATLVARRGLAEWEADCVFTSTNEGVIAFGAPSHDDAFLSSLLVAQAVVSATGEAVIAVECGGAPVVTATVTTVTPDAVTLVPAVDWLREDVQAPAVDPVQVAGGTAV